MLQPVYNAASGATEAEWEDPCLGLVFLSLVQLEDESAVGGVLLGTIGLSLLNVALNTLVPRDTHYVIIYYSIALLRAGGPPQAYKTPSIII